MDQQVMANNIFLTLLMFMVACGREVNISNQKLQYNSSLSNGSTTTANQEGVLIRGPKDQITTNGKSYPVSMYSSYLALEFIAGKPLNAQLQVKFRGTIIKNEMKLELIELK